MTPVICLVTDRRRLTASSEDALVDQVAAAVRRRIHLVQVRERDLEGGALLRLVRRCVDAARGSSTRILVNDRLDVALAAGADGIHLRGDSFSAARARQVAPRRFLIGRSVHSVDEARRVAADGALDYLVFGPVFDTASKPGQPAAGAPALRQVVAATALPVLALGGVTRETMPALAGTGAAGYAAIGLFAAPPEQWGGEVIWRRE